MHPVRRLLGAVALLVGVAAPAALATGLAQSPARAAEACTPQGVTVIVDFGALGGGVQQSCASSAGKAAALFVAAGHSLSRVQSAPSAVCSVDAKPADPCPQMPPANAYWGLFWANGSTTKWTYASLGVDAQSVPAGGSVAFAWQSSAGTRTPGVAPAVTKVAAPSAKPTKLKTHPKPTPKPSRKAATKPAMKPSATPTPSARPSVSAGVSPSSMASRSASPTVAASTTPSASPSVIAPESSAAASATPMTQATEPTAASTQDGGGLPGWVAPAAVIVVLAAGGGVVARRRLRG